MIDIDQTIQPADLAEKLDRLWQLSAGRIQSIEHSWSPECGSPVFTVAG